MSQQPPALVLASLVVVTGANDQVDESTRVPVHFNPTSLQLGVSNELKDTKNNERKQYIAKSSAKLTMDLVFDTTESGADVAATTRKIQAFLVPETPPGQSAARETPPPLVLFEWGALRFKGIAENYRETIDYFSPEGVPLRSSVNLTLSRQDKVFDEAPAGAGGGGGVSVSAGIGGSAQLAAGIGSPGAARGIASLNGEESLRFSAGASLTVSGGVQLKSAAAFSTGASAGVGGSAGLSLGAGAGLSIGGSAGLSARAGLSATEGAFAGLCTTSSSGASVSVDTASLHTGPAGAKLSVDAKASFGLGGASASDTPAGLRADVGVGTPLKLTFD